MKAHIISSTDKSKNINTQNKSNIKLNPAEVSLPPHFTNKTLNVPEQLSLDDFQNPKAQEVSVNTSPEPAKEEKNVSANEQNNVINTADSLENTPKSKTQIKKWRKNYNLVKKYIAQNHILPTSKTEYKGVLIGSWLANQKTKYKQGNLPDECIDKLVKLGFNLPPAENNQAYIKAWNNTAKIVEKFVYNNEYPISVSDEYKKVNVGVWLNNNLSYLGKGLLSEEQEKIIRELSVIEASKIESDDIWFRHFKLLERYVIETNQMPVSDTIEGVNIGEWCREQNELKKRNLLSEERSLLLQNMYKSHCISDKADEKKPKQIYMDSRTLDGKWYVIFELVKSYVNETGYFPDENTVYNDYPIGKWWIQQKELSEKNMLYTECVNEMNNLKGKDNTDYTSLTSIFPSIDTKKSEKEYTEKPISNSSSFTLSEKEPMNDILEVSHKEIELGVYIDLVRDGLITLDIAAQRAEIEQNALKRLINAEEKGKSKEHKRLTEKWQARGMSSEEIQKLLS